MVAECGFESSNYFNQQVPWGGAVLVMKGRWFEVGFGAWLFRVLGRTIALVVLCGVWGGGTGPLHYQMSMETHSEVGCGLTGMEVQVAGA